MEPEDSLPCSQQPATCSYYQSDDSSPQYPNLHLTSILILLPIYVQVFRLVFSLQVFPTKILYAFFTSPMRAPCLVHLILLDFITLINFIEVY
jgi:hypothetical protein